MTQPSSPTPGQINSLKAYKQLPLKEQVAILGAVAKLRGMQAEGIAPSKEAMKKLLEETGHYEIAMDCYSAHLMRNQQWN